MSLLHLRKADLTATYPRISILRGLGGEDQVAPVTSAANSQRDTFQTHYEAWKIRYNSYMAPLIAEASRSVPLDLQAAPLIPELADTTEFTSPTTSVTPSDSPTGGSGTPQKQKDPPNPNNVRKAKSDEHQAIEAMKILLPLSYSVAMQNHSSLETAANAEKKLRESQAHDALVELRAQIITLYGFRLKAGNAPARQGSITKSQHRKQRAISAAAVKYRRARTALISLGMPETDSTYCVLKPEDIVPFPVTDEMRELGDSRRNTTSWIWEDLSFVKNANDGKIAAYYENGEYSSTWSAASAELH